MQDPESDFGHKMEIANLARELIEQGWIYRDNPRLYPEAFQALALTERRAARIAELRAARKRAWAYGASCHYLRRKSMLGWLKALLR